MTLSTIAAISTPPGPGGIGIVKISGPRALEIGRFLFKSGSAPAPGPFPAPRHMYFGRIIHPETGDVIDEALFVYMAAPQTYTAEDVVEFQCHGGPVVLQTVLSQAIKAGARLAEPGEFTRRAFLNGRIDLSQAEAVIDLINATSLRAARIGAAQMSGELKTVVTGLRSIFQKILVQLETAIDFPEDADDVYDLENPAGRLEAEVIPEIRHLIEAHETLNCLRKGVRAVIAGSPNVGKSSLMNRLVSRERAIVTDTPGTTRDVIEEPFSLRGIPVIATDTAGIHDSPGPIERMGIDQAWHSLQAADLLLFVVDAGRTVSPAELSLLKQLPDQHRILVINKIDLPPAKQFFQLPSAWAKMPRVEISALYNIGINDLKDQMEAIIAGSSQGIEDPLVPNLRQKIALETCQEALLRAASGLSSQAPAELVSIDLRSALDALAEITGESVSFDVLEAIFSQFCIGK